MATPATYARYTGNWKGTYVTWVQTPESSGFLRMIKKTVPGLDCFWLACGSWRLEGCPPVQRPHAPLCRRCAAGMGNDFTPKSPRPPERRSSRRGARHPGSSCADSHTDSWIFSLLFHGGALCAPGVPLSSEDGFFGTRTGPRPGHRQL